MIAQLIVKETSITESQQRLCLSEPDVSRMEQGSVEVRLMERVGG